MVVLINVLFLLLMIGAILWLAGPASGRRRWARIEEERERSNAKWLAQGEAWNQPAPHRGPCRCSDCVIANDDPPDVRFRKAMRGLGVPE